MKVVDALRVGWRQVMLHRRMWLVLYLCNLVFALMAVIPLRGWLKGAAGHSMALTKSIGQFNFTFLTDLIRNHEGYSVLCSQALLMIVAYVIFSAFTSGGILHMYVHWREQFLLKEFMNGSVKYFWRMLRTNVYFLLLQIVLIAILFMVLMAIGMDPKEMESDVQFMRLLLWILPAYLLFVIVVAVMHLYVKVHVVWQDINPITKSMIAGVRFVLRNPVKVALVFLVNLLLLILLFISFSMLKEIIPGGTAWGILFSFILSQVFMIGRIVIKLLTLSTANELIQGLTHAPQDLDTSTTINQTFGPIP